MRNASKHPLAVCEMPGNSPNGLSGRLVRGVGLHRSRRCSLRVRGYAALASGIPRLVAGELMGGAGAVGGDAAAMSELAHLGAIHRRKAALLLDGLDGGHGR